MREVKFRAWDNYDKKMVSWMEILENRSYTYDFMNNVLKNLIPQQFTGLLDKNGKEIYEGDICRGTMPDTERDEPFDLMEVKYEDASFSLYRIKNNRGLYFGELDMPALNKSIEVIGNIFENSELLN